MGNIITLSGGDHLETQSLLPWYVSRRLDAAECTRIEAHLADCPECRADVAAERRLAAEWASLPIETETSWLRLRDRMIADDADRAGSAIMSRLAAIVRRAVKVAPRWPTGLGWALAAAQAVALVAIGVSFRTPMPTPAPAYHTLGAAPAAADANMLVIFNPDTSEGGFRDALIANHARIVDGPTASGAYVLHVPAGERSAILTRMRARRDVALAQPIDPGAIR
jgi:anti-sigma factor RsiW